MYPKNQHGSSLVKIVIVMAAFVVLAWVVLPYLRKSQKPASPVTKIGVQQPMQQQQKQQQQPVTVSSPIPWPPIARETTPPLTEMLLKKNYYVVLDGSGSMSKTGCSGRVSKFQSAAAALKDFFISIPADANVGLFIFDGNGFSEKVALGVNNREQLRQAVDTAVPDGGTPLSKAVQAGYKALTAQAGLQLGYGEYHLVVVTDGDASEGYDPTSEVNRIIDNTAIVIHTIGYCIGEGHSLNQPGRTLYSSVDNAQSLSRELKAVLAEAEAFDITQFQ